MKGKILIVEDDVLIQEFLNETLGKDGYEVAAVSKAADAALIYGNAKDTPINLVILDLGLPDKDGMNVLKDLRLKSPKTSILVISARARESDKVSALDAGASDYIQKPFSMPELMARIRACLRTAVAEVEEGTFQNGPLTIDYGAHNVFLGGKEVRFTNNEYKILCLLSRNVGKTLTHNAIIANVWGENGNDGNGLRVFMAGIRRKIEKTPYTQDLIRTDVGVGYRMNKL